MYFLNHLASVYYQMMCNNSVTEKKKRGHRFFFACKYLDMFFQSVCQQGEVPVLNELYQSPELLDGYEELLIVYQ